MPRRCVAARGALLELAEPGFRELVDPLAIAFGDEEKILVGERLQGWIDLARARLPRAAAREFQTLAELVTMSGPFLKREK